MASDQITSQFQTFFVIDSSLGASIDYETIWDDIRSKYVFLSDDDMNSAEFKKQFILMLDDTPYIESVLKKYNCNIRDILRVIVQYRFEYFDKYLVKKIILSLRKYQWMKDC